MAYTSLPQLASLNKLQSNNVEKTLSEILQSEPVRRLLNQPNIIIKTVPLNIQPKSNFMTNSTNSNIIDVPPSIYENKNNGIDSYTNRIKQPNLSIFSTKSNKNENMDDENLLPSKTEGKSEISLQPIRKKKKDCGHCGPCENVTCDVIVEQCIDNDGLSFMLAFNIEEHEIDAPVWKHCKNSSCDALSIDHDRCRRAIIRLNKFDKYKMCDICGVTLKTRKSRVHHKNCRRRNEYRHNEIDGAKLLKERMRERELQMLEDAKTKKQDYMDPITGYNRAMDFLRKNDELIIIPKTQSSLNQSSVTVTSPSNQINQQQTNNVGNISSKYLPNMPLVYPQQNIVLSKSAGSNETSVTQTNLIHTPNSKPVTTTSTTIIPNQLIKLANPPQTSIQSVSLNNWLLSQSHIVTASTLNSKFITPIRVVPITNLITQPSLLHQTQGIPKFCIMTDNSLPALTVPDIKPIISPKPIISSKSIISPKPIRPNGNLEEIPKQEKSPKRKKSGVKKSVRKRNRKKDLKCNYCNKHFSTDWYFKIHVAMHSGEKPFTCRLCQESFSNRYDLKKHLTNDHKDESINCNDCDFICTSYSSLDKHMKTHSHKCADCNNTFTTINDLNSHKNKCNSQIETNINNTADKELETKEIKNIGKEKKHNNSNDLCNKSKEKRVNGTGVKLLDVNKKSIKKQEKKNKVSLEETNGVKVNGVDSLP